MSVEGGSPRYLGSYWPYQFANRFMRYPPPPPPPPPHHPHYHGNNNAFDSKHGYRSHSESCCSSQWVCVLITILVGSLIIVGVVLAVVYGLGRTSNNNGVTTTATVSTTQQPITTPVPQSGVDNYSAAVRFIFNTTWNSSLSIYNSTAFINMEQTTCAQMALVFQVSLSSVYVANSCVATNFSQGSVIASLRFTFNFPDDTTNVDNSLVIRAAIIDAVNTGITTNIDTSTLSVNAAWDNNATNVCERYHPCQQFCAPGNAASTDTAFICYCAPGYQLASDGSHCVEQDPCASAPCENFGHCVPISDNGYTCVCPPHYSGFNCDQQPPMCTNTTCANGGTCFSSTLGGTLKCVCPPGFTDDTCSTAMNNCANTTCLNNGVCQSMLGGDYSCNCTSGYFGQHCEMSANSCASNPCTNGSTCIPGVGMFTCMCPPQNTGLLCERNRPEVFSVYKSSTPTALRSIFSFDAFAVQRSLNVAAGSGVYSPPNGTYLMSISGASLYQKMLVMGLVGYGTSTLEIELANSEIVNGIITTSNTFVLPVDPTYFFGVTIPIISYSDPSGKQTSWSAFRLEDFLNPLIAFNTYATSQSYANPMPISYKSPATANIGGAWSDDASATFTAPVAGVYVFSHTAYTVYTSATFDMTINVRGSPMFELVRTVTSNSALTTIGQTVAVSLAAGDNVTTTLVSGHIQSSSFDSMWSGFLYQPVSTQPNVIWSVHRTTNVVGALNPVTYDTVGVNVGGGWNSTINKVVIPYSGAYMIHITAATNGSNIMNYQLMWNGNPYANIYCNTTDFNGIDMRSRGIMVDAKVGDTLHVATDSTTNLYSTANKLISFTGYFVAF